MFNDFLVSSLYVINMEPAVVNRNIMFRLFFLLLLVVTGLPSPAWSLASDTQNDDAVTVRLISGVDGVGQNAVVPLALDVTLADGWHTYWRSPGEAGLPPNIDWKDSLLDTGNLKAATLLYPAPKRHNAYGLETIGYNDHIVFPIDAELKVPGKPLAISAEVSLLVCSSVCVPKNYFLKLTVPAGNATDSADAALIKQFRDKVPTDGETSGILVQSIVNDGQSLTFNISSSGPLTQPDIFIEDDKDISFSAPTVTVSSDKQYASLKVKPIDTLPDGTTLADLHLTLTLTDGDRATEQHMNAPAITEAPAAYVPPMVPLGWAIFFALIGGFILNLMPCVLPVLSLKILSVIGHGGGETRLVRHSFLVTAAGILFSFLVLGGITILLQKLGMAIGWGVQFQQPLFLIFLILLLTVFTANMWGLFEIQLPRFLADAVGDAGYHPKLAGDFASGAFATLLATPCSAPFLGTAINFALASGPANILIIFVSLGMGMIVPYLLIAIFPSLATSLPKPGAWMSSFRRILGCALAITAIWLLWVLSAQITGQFALIVGFCMVALLLLFAMQQKTTISKKIIWFGVVCFAALAMSLTIGGMHMPKMPTDVARLWQPYSDMALTTEIAEGKTVFLDVTADWCLTCKANKQFVLSRGDIEQRIFHTDIIAMQADWTNPDPAITALLRKYNRYGIPFNVVFGPNNLQGIVLPELLTPEKVIDALNAAQGK